MMREAGDAGSRGMLGAAGPRPAQVSGPLQRNRNPRESLAGKAQQGRDTRGRMDGASDAAKSSLWEDD